MLSDLARDDLAGLRADGLEPTDEDIVRLNSVALKRGLDSFLQLLFRYVNTIVVL